MRTITSLTERRSREVWRENGGIRGVRSGRPHTPPTHNSLSQRHESNESPTTSSGELPHPTALGATRPWLVEGGASCFCVSTCIQRGHSGSRLRRRLPFTGGLECPTPTRWTLDHNRQCALLVALEHRRRCGEHRTTSFGRSGSKRGGERVCEPCGRCIPSLLASSTLAEEGGLAPSI